MECSICEDKGLVYCAREPEECETPEAHQHFADNPECLSECEKYWKVQEECRAPGLLDAVPAPSIDAEILRVCADGRTHITAASAFPSFFRKALLPLSLFVMAFIAVGYVALNMGNARHTQGTGIAKASIKTVQPTAPQLATVKDSLKDSTKGSYAKNRGNLEGTGVITVDLEKNK
jgi:hypothetical protein